VTEIEVRDCIAPRDVIIGPVVVRNQMRTKQIDAKLLPTERRTIGRAVLLTRYSLLPDVANVVNGNVRESEILIVPTGAVATR
jgi:hypothetical protein